MKAIIATLLLLCSTVTANADKSDYTVMKFGADWCAPCKQMDKVWGHKSVTVLLKQFKHGHVITVDANKRADLPLYRKYRVEKIPTVIIVDNNGKSVRRAVGYMNVVQLKSFLSKKVTVGQKETVEVFGAFAVIRDILRVLFRFLYWLFS